MLRNVYFAKSASHKNATDEWKSKHKAGCFANHKGSSGAMEKKVPSKCSFAQSKSIDFDILFTLEMETQVRSVQ